MTPLLLDSELDALRPDHAKVEMGDGVQLETQVYLPVQGCALPTVLIRDRIDSDIRAAFNRQMALGFAKFGLAAVVQHTRNSASRHGAADLLKQEAADGSHTVDWITQQPWSNGRVATWGEGFGGVTQWALSTVRHPAHRAMAPRMTERYGASSLPVQSEASIPVLHSIGFFDPARYEQLGNWETAQAGPASGHQYLRAHASDQRGYKWREIGMKLERDFNADPNALYEHMMRILAEPVSFLRHYLGDYPGPWVAPKVRYEIARNGWRGAKSWPPETSRRTDLYWKSGATQVLSAAKDAASSAWTLDITSTAPHTLQPIADSLGAGDSNDSVVSAYTSVSSADTPKLTWDLLLVGPTSIRLSLTPAAAGVPLVARLLDVHPDGVATVITEGETLVPPGSDAGAFQIELGDVAYRVPRGHRIRALLAGERARTETGAIEIASATLSLPLVQKNHPDFLR